MSASISQLKVMMTLVKREFREHRLLFVYVPLVATLLSIIVATGSVVRDLLTDELLPPGLVLPEDSATVERITRIAILTRGSFFAARYMAQIQPMVLAFWATMAFYHLFSLYRQRQDRSILFWNSLPVSDAQTLVSKLLAGLLGCHLVYALCFAALGLCQLLFLFIHGWYSGIDGPYTFFAGAFSSATFRIGPGPDDFYTFSGGPLSYFPAFAYLAHLPLTILWSLPVYAWLLLASAMAPRAPFAWAMGPLVLLIIPEVIITDRSWVAATLFEHAIPSVSFLTMTGYPWAELAVSAVLGVGLLYAAIRLNRPDDS